ncbi:peroxide stress protein YaaA [Conyzicola nivalis]|uniref:Peroxide stress protein YaaA n=1 Tax=Conyzicola nivalis TaxID=1477021 RepID=A0A916SDJ0_9MICO|nr:peroxide stress protein YaaA [Conyzicola nivalis]GGA92280.1 peroxide stress protein YaaA [Conyzicola nivalis]
MLVLLPPSETKRDGGEAGRSLDLTALRHPQLTAQRSAAVSALTALSRDVVASTAALGLGPTQGFEIERNNALESSPVMPAIDRYTGVLYDGIDTVSLTAEQRAWVVRHVVVNSALFGLLGAGDEIPAYRLSHDSRLPGLPLKKLWRAANAEVLAATPGVILDLRSESYAALGPLPGHDDAHYLRVVTQTATGQKKALTHFNKKGKGVFVRQLAQAGRDHESVESLLEWAATSGVRLDRGKPGELELTV